MELSVHDIVKLSDPSLLVGSPSVPEWVTSALAQTPYAVVRREPWFNHLVPVGVRGNNRNERFAAFIPLQGIVDYVTPESLSSELIWSRHARFQQMKAIHSLQDIKSILESLDMRWGPTGSVGFELATGLQSVHDHSDLDLIIRTDQIPSTEVARSIIELISHIAERIDIRIETPSGAIALAELAQGNSKILLRTKYGPRLVEIAYIQ